MNDLEKFAKVEEIVREWSWNYDMYNVCVGICTDDTGRIEIASSGVTFLIILTNNVCVKCLVQKDRVPIKDEWIDELYNKLIDIEKEPMRSNNMKSFKFDEEVYVVGDAYLLQKFTHVDGTVKAEEMYGILTSYTPNELTFMTINGPLTYEASMDDSDSNWSPRKHIDVHGNEYTITMMGLKANLSVIEQTFKLGTPYYIETPKSWINIPSFHGIYSGYNEKDDLWEWPEIKFMSKKGEIRLHFSDILRGVVNVSEMGNRYIPIRFDV